MSKRMTPSLTAQHKRLAYTRAVQAYAGQRSAKRVKGISEIAKRAAAAEKARYRDHRRWARPYDNLYADLVGAAWCE